MTLEESVLQILDLFDKDEYFDSHTVINILLSKPEYRLAYMKGYSEDSDINQYHAKIATLIRFSNKVKPVGNANAKSLCVYGNLTKNQLWQKS